MRNILLISRQRIMKLCIVAVLLGSPAITLALPIYRPGGTYCLCNCATSAGVRDIYWLKGAAACSLANGGKCKSKDVGGVEGRLNSCTQCTATDGNTLSCRGTVGGPQGGALDPGSPSRGPVRPGVGGGGGGVLQR